MSSLRFVLIEKKIMDGKKHVMREIATIRQTSYKFASIFNENEIKIDEESKENDMMENLEDLQSEMEDETDDDMNKKKLDSYSFGIRWYYWEYYKDLEESDQINGGQYKDFYIPCVHKVCLSMFNVEYYITHLSVIVVSCGLYHA